MLTKPPLRTLVPGIPGVAARAAFTTCASPPPGPSSGGTGGGYVTVCTTVAVQVGVGSGSIGVGNGNNGVPIYHYTEVCRSEWRP